MASPPASNADGSALSDSRLLLRRERYRDPSQTAYHVRYLLAIVNILRPVALKLGVHSRLITFCWFIVGLVAHTISAIGAPWAFIIGALLVNLKIALDITDGEIGRFEKRSLDDHADAVAHMKGIYLDRMQHAVESPLWGIGLGIGAYRLTGMPWTLVAGVVLAVFRSFCRFDSLVRRYLRHEFRSRLEARSDDDAKNAATDLHIWNTVSIWIRNGKRFNLFVLLAAIFDWLAIAAGQLPLAIPTLLGVAAIVGSIEMIVRLASSQFTDSLIESAKAKKSE